MPRPRPSIEEVTAAVVAFLNDHIMAASHRVAADDLLAAAGVDSMALLKVLVFIERAYGLWIPDEALTDDVIATARTLAAYICRAAA